MSRRGVIASAQVETIRRQSSAYLSVRTAVVYQVRVVNGLVAHFFLQPTTTKFGKIISKLLPALSYNWLDFGRSCRIEIDRVR